MSFILSGRLFAIDLHGMARDIESA